MLGVLVSVLGVLLQGASAAGVSLWSSLKGSIVEGTLETRFGWVWAVRAIVWLALGALLLATRAVGRDDPAAGAEADADAAGRCSRRPPRPLRRAAALGAAYLTITPALAGHASVESPVGVFFPSDAIHVLAASVWVGGIACLLLALPAATRQLERAERSRLLLDARALLADRARRGRRDRYHRRASGLHRRAQPARPAAHDLRRADPRQDRAVAGADRSAGSTASA